MDREPNPMDCTVDEMLDDIVLTYEDDGVIDLPTLIEVLRIMGKCVAENQHAIDNGGRR